MTYAELYDYKNNTALRNRVTVACMVAAEAIRSEDPGTANHANRMTWAKRVFGDPDAAGAQMLFAVLAANKDATPEQVEAATDGQIQTVVGNAVNVFATGS